MLWSGSGNQGLWCGNRVAQGLGLGSQNPNQKSTTRMIHHHHVVYRVLLLLLLLLLTNSSFNSRSDTTTTTTADAFSFESIRDKRVLVIGGSGRVGGSVVTQLIRRGAGQVVVGGTDVERFAQAMRRWQELFPPWSSSFSNTVSFVALDRDDKESILPHLAAAASASGGVDGPSSSWQEKFDLVVNTAGPFQGKVGQSAVLAACLERNIAYVDVCDDYGTARAAKTQFDARAVASGTPCIVATGCWPGVSSLMAKQLIDVALQRHPSLRPADLSVDFSFFTAGSGGAGVSLLVATFLILAERALTIVRGRRIAVPPMTGYATVDFGKTVGNRDVAFLNLLETASLHDNLRVGNVASRFGTAPDFWNVLLGSMAKLPTSILQNEELMRNLSVFSLPIVRLVDAYAGATNAMRCDVRTTTTKKTTKDDNGDNDGTCYTAIYAHENLEPCVGECVLAFCAAVLGGAVRGGVHFPEEAMAAGDDVAQVLAMASVGAHTEVHTSNGSSDSSVTSFSSNTVNLTHESVWGTRPEGAGPLVEVPP